MHHNRAGIGMSRAFPVHLRIEPISQSLVLRKRRPWNSRRWHHAGAKLANHALPYLRVIASRVQVLFLQTEIRDFELVVMTSDAVLVEQSPLRGGSVRRHGWS